MPGTPLRTMDKIRPMLLIASIFFGLLVGALSPEYSGLFNAIIYVALVLLIFSLVLGASFREIFHSMKNIRFFAIAWFLNFLVIPVIAFVLAWIFLGPYPAIFVGFILYLIAPCTDWFLMFTAMANGDVPLGLALLPTNLILQILLIPIYLYIFTAKIIPFQISALIETLAIFIILPFLMAWVTRWSLRKVRSEKWGNEVKSNILPNIQLIILMVIIFSMFAGQTRVIIDNIGPLSIIFVPVILFFAISFLIVQLVSRKMKLRYEECALLTCTTAARNSPLSLAIAVGLFPGQPLVQVAIIIPVLIELPLLLAVVRGLRIIKDKHYSLLIKRKDVPSK